MNSPLLFLVYGKHGSSIQVDIAIRHLDIHSFDYSHRILVKHPKAELQQSFSACVYCMRLRFQRNELGWLKSR